MGLLTELTDAWSDLWLGGRCAGCDRPGRSLCTCCADLLLGPARVAWPDPAPPGLPTPACVSAYDGPVREVLLAHKEHARYGLHLALGRGLAAAVALLATDLATDLPADLADGLTGERGGDTGTPLRLVPVPTRAAVVRARGHDPLLRMTRVAARILRADGVPAQVAPALLQRRRPADQSGLDARGRAANLRGAFEVWPRSGTLLDATDVVVTDDILTTGATATEAARALRCAGARVRGVATVAATTRRTTPSQPTGSRHA